MKLHDFKIVILNTYKSSTSARDHLAAFHSRKIINFLPDLFSTITSEDNLYAPHFERIMRVHVRELMRNMRQGGKAKYGAYFSLRHFQQKIIVFNNWSSFVKLLYMNSRILLCFIPKIHFLWDNEIYFRDKNEYDCQVYIFV